MKYLLLLLSLNCFAVDYQPITNEFIIHPGTGGHQIWPSLSIDESRNRIWAVYSQSNETYARAFDLDFNPVFGPVQVNTTTNLQQDEPAIQVDPVSGRVLVAWSDRSGFYTQYMDVRGRILDTVTGQFISPEFPLRDPVNGHTPTESKWRPMLEKHPLGGWVGAWTSGWDEEAMMGWISPDGLYNTGDLMINIYNGGHQDYPDIKISENGTIYAIYLNLYQMFFAKIYNPNFQVVKNQFALSPSPNPQLEMRLETWKDRVVAIWYEFDGDDKGIKMRIFDQLLKPITSVIPVNDTIIGLQKDPDMKIAADGTIITAWEDHFGGVRNYRYKLFNKSGTPLSGERTINQTVADNLSSSVVAPAHVSLINGGRKAVICWQGKSGSPTGQQDAYCRVLLRL